MDTTVGAREAQLSELARRLPAAAPNIARILDQASRDVQLRVCALLIEHGALDEAEVALLAAGGDATGPDGESQIAELWLRLARALQRAGRSEAVAPALRRAAAGQFAPGFVALARHLRRDPRTLPEAIACLRQAIRIAPGDSSAYFELGRLQQEANEPQAAVSTYLELLDVAPGLANVLMVAEATESLTDLLGQRSPERRLRIALLGNATLDHLKSFVKVDCLRAGLVPTIYQSGFDQYTQDMLDPRSGLYDFRPDVVVCAIHASRLFPRIHHYPFDITVDDRRAEMDAGLRTLERLLETFTARSHAMLLLHNMVLPHYPALGILDARDELGQSAAFSEINLRLAELVRNRYPNVYLVDEERIQAHRGKDGATDPRLWLNARMPWREDVLAGLSREYLRYIGAARGLSRKCVIVDLDNTLWGGVVGEDGVAGLQLGSEAPGNAFVAFQTELEKLTRRGVLLAVCSKNNPEDALPVLEHHPDMVLRPSHFAAMRINWQSKADNIRDIARELNIGLDSLVFLDDNPVERAAVRAELPQVLTPELPRDPAEYRRTLLDVAWRFDTLALTDEDRNRNRLYAEQRLRQQAEAELTASGSVQAYLEDLQIVIEIEAANEISRPRVAQLTSKTNQFNLTTRRYTVADIAHMQKCGMRVLSARVGDRFGDNGLTGVAIVEPLGTDAWSIDTLLLSCRVMGRGVETALLASIAQEARRSGVRFLRGAYVPTAKNAVVRSLYADHGFSLLEETAQGHTRWQLDLRERTIDPPAWVVVREPLLAG